MTYRGDVAMCADDKCPSRARVGGMKRAAANPTPPARTTPTTEGKPMHNAAASTAPHTPQPTRETPEGVLTHLQENDYRLDGNSCWISVGPHVVYIFQRPDGVVVEVFEEAPGQLTGPVKEAFVRIEPE